MNKRYKHNAMLHLAKGILTAFHSIFIYWMFRLAIKGDHFITGLIVFFIFTLVIFISGVQLIYFVRDMIRAK